MSLSAYRYLNRVPLEKCVALSSCTEDSGASELSEQLLGLPARSADPELVAHCRRSSALAGVSEQGDIRLRLGTDTGF